MLKTFLWFKKLKLTIFVYFQFVFFYYKKKLIHQKIQNILQYDVLNQVPTVTANLTPWTTRSTWTSRSSGAATTTSSSTAWPGIASTGAASSGSALARLISFLFPGYVVNEQILKWESVGQQVISKKKSKYWKFFLAVES